MTSGQVIQLGRFGATIETQGLGVDRLRSLFRRDHFVRLPQLLEPKLLGSLLATLDGATFEDLDHDGVGTEQWMPEDVLPGALSFLMNDSRLIELVEGVAECGHVGSFSGRVYRLLSGGRYSDSWHTDLGDDRLVALSLNLSRDSYAGGVLQIRDRATRSLLAEVENQGLGDAVLFRIREDLEHRVTDVHGPHGRTAFAGWFRSSPDFLGLLYPDSGADPPS